MDTNDIDSVHDSIAVSILTSSAESALTRGLLYVGIALILVRVTDDPFHFLWLVGAIYEWYCNVKYRGMIKEIRNKYK